MGRVLDLVHGGWVHQRRVRVLGRHFADLLPEGARVLDVGCGDGSLGELVGRLRDDVELRGIDIAARPDAHIPVEVFDGRTIPFGDDEFDAVMLVDVLHHDDDPRGLLAEAVRVARRAVLVKDVIPLGALADPTLRFMDWIGNARHGVPLPYRWWTQAEWRAAFGQLGVSVDEDRRRLGLYPLPFNLLFERRMHFIVRLIPPAYGRA